MVASEDADAAGKFDAIEEAGARTRVVPDTERYDARIERCRDLVESSPREYFWPNQYANEANVRAHETTTGPEIWTQTDGDVTCFVAGAGTGGTLTGVGRYLTDRTPVRVVGVEPARPTHDVHGLRDYLNGGRPEGCIYDADALGDRRIVATDAAERRTRWLRDRYRDERLRVHDTGQYDEPFVRDHLRVDGEFRVGPSSGAAVEMLVRLDHADVLDDDDVVVCPLCDRGDRYPGLW